MRKINKGEPPESFTHWVRQKPKSMTENQWFKALYLQKEWKIVSDLSRHNAAEQFYLCAYCCNSITGEPSDTVNEHVEARDVASKRSLDHTNIVASCNKENQCDNAHDNQVLNLTPLMNECETELKFKINGRVEGLTDRAKNAIQVLNLGDNEVNNKSLIEKRKKLAHDLMWTTGIDPTQGLEDDDLLLDLINDLVTPDKEGKLLAFAPVIANILRNWITPQ